MKKILLTQGQSALVDEGDFELLSKWKWQVKWNPHTRSYYANRKQVIANGKRKSLYMSRVIMDAPKDFQVDHINHDTLDNRRSNLRLATRSQNQINSGKRKVNKSGYKGVSFYKETKKWKARINYNNKNIHLGYFTDIKEAARAYDAKASEIFGKFAFLNYP